MPFRATRSPVKCAGGPPALSVDRSSVRGAAGARSQGRRRDRRLRRARAAASAGLPERDHLPTSGMPRPRQIFRARTSDISLWRGTASMAPVAGLVHKACEPPLPLQMTAVPPEVPQQVSSLHPTTTVSRTASRGRPRRPSRRRSSRIRAIASAKLSRASALVRPCPFAPGISGL